MKYLTFLSFSVLTAILIGSCCEECTKPDLGEFGLKPATVDWIAFTQDRSRRFKSSLGTEEIMTYGDLQSGFEELSSDCDPDLKCGLCCNSFQGGYLYTQFFSTTGSYIFDMTLQKDFGQYSDLDDPDKILDKYAINFNNRLFCEIYGIPDTTLTGTITLNNRDFTGVYTCKADLATSGSGPTDPIAFYFNIDDGIIGFETGDGTIWNLEP